MRAFNFSSPSLTYISLDLSGNQITSLPNGVFNFATLLSFAQFSIRDNQLPTVPSNAFVLQSPWISFDLSGNKIKTFDSRRVQLSFIGHYLHLPGLEGKSNHSHPIRCIQYFSCI